MANKYIRDTLGKFRSAGRVGTGKKVKTARGLGKERGGGRSGGSKSAGGTIAGTDAGQTLLNKKTKQAEEVTSGSKLKSTAKLKR